MDLQKLKEAIRQENLDGWLFCNFRHRDKLADEILAINPDANNSRRWAYAVAADGEPLKIVHAIEAGALDSLDGRKTVYISRNDFLAALRGLAGKRWGVHASNTLAAVSYLDAGTAETLTEAGLALCSAEGLIQRFKGTLDLAGIASHERAAGHLYDIVALAWDRVRQAHAGGETLYERDIQDLIESEIAARGLYNDHPAIVAAGANAGNPHYALAGAGAPFAEGDVIQFDLWGKEKTPGGVYADISWAGVYAEAVPARVAADFAVLVKAREGALAAVAAAFAAGDTIRGAEVDALTRRILEEAGYGAALKHRTGHGIDTELHGSGVNMDSIEFPDNRPVLEGSCFSLEPGIYFEKYGFRTEIDVYIVNGTSVVSGGEHKRQFDLLHC